MKTSHTALSTVLLLSVSLLMNIKSTAQCPGGEVPGGVAYDTTVSTGSGNYATVFKFPKFDPQAGMVTCVRLCITITGVVNMFLENNVTSPASYNINYTRKDSLTGPGLNSPLTNQVTTTYGPIPLGATDGIPFSGPDFQTIGPSTVLNAVTICKTITDSVDLTQFYGLDSVAYTYKINAGAVVTGSGDYLFSVATTGFVNYRLEYCYCPPVTLPGGMSDFLVTKTNESKIALTWRDEDPSIYHFEVEMSRDGGAHFETVGTVEKNSDERPDYRHMFDVADRGRYFFRIRKVNSNGRSYFTPLKYVDAGQESLLKFNVYPNPSNGIVGIKFDNISAGKYLVLIHNAQGQTVVQKEIEVSGNMYQQITTLNKGFYWVKLLNIGTKQSSVNQLLIK